MSAYVQLLQGERRILPQDMGILGAIGLGATTRMVHKVKPTSFSQPFLHIFAIV